MRSPAFIATELSFFAISFIERQRDNARRRFVMINIPKGIDVR
jgi:hypothetical protein